MSDQNWVKIERVFDAPIDEVWVFVIRAFETKGSLN
jgi:hypothetical protein